MNIENTLCPKHQQKIILVSIDDRILPENSYFCNQCLSENQGILQQSIAVEHLQNYIREKLAQLRAVQEESLSKQLEKLQSFKSILIELKQHILDTLELNLERVESWENDLKIDTSKIYEGIDIHQALVLIKKGNDHPNDIQQINSNHLFKLCSAFKDLLVTDKIKTCYQFLEEQIKNQNHQMSFQMINQIKQEEPCFAMSFSGSQLITGSERNIKVWEFQGGQMKLLQELKGQGNRITCLQSSHSNKWFVSGDCDGNIRSWMQVQSQWTSKLSAKKHSSFINCILLTKNEDKLITCGEEKTILIWNVMTGTNQIVFDYALQQKHNDSVLGLSLNQSESELVSFGADKQIILWVKGSDGKWTFKSSLSLKKSLGRICYFHDNLILAQQGGEGYSNVLVIDEQIKLGEELKLNGANEKEDFILFPTIYNRSRGIIIQKSNQYVYLLRKRNDGKLISEAPPINCKTQEIYGALSDNGEHLIIWNGQAKEFQVFEIIQS